MARRAEGESEHFAQVAYGDRATPDNGLHPTRDTTPVIKLYLACG